MILSALEGIVPPDRIYGTELDYDGAGEVQSIVRVPAGYGKVAVVEELEGRFDVTPDRTIYVGDGNSDVHVMLHVNNRDGFTIAVSENRPTGPDCEAYGPQRRCVLDRGADLDQVLGWEANAIRALFGSMDSRSTSGSARGPTGSSSVTTPRSAAQARWVRQRA